MSLMRTKPVEDVLAQNRDEPDAAGGEGQGRLRKRLGALDLVGFGIGIVIGTGIFTLTGVEAKLHAGPAVVLSFLVAGVVSVLAALCYAELASAVPTAGSAYTYAYTTLGEPIAWIIGWDLVLEFALGASVVAAAGRDTSATCCTCRRPSSARSRSSTSGRCSSFSCWAWWPW